MGCVSSSFLDDDANNLPPTFHHHIVSLTSTTYGLLSTLDTSPPPPSSTQTETINSWELMAGLDHLQSFEKRCPPGGDQSVVLYTTTIRGIRKTFEDCNAVRAVFEGLGVRVMERDVSMDLGFRGELRRLVGGSVALPRVFVSGRYVGGVEEVMRIHEEGGIGGLVEGLPKVRRGGVCDGCGGVRFLPCFRCSGSRKLIVLGSEGGKGKGEEWRKGKVVRCPDCNENGLMFCPICS